MEIKDMLNNYEIIGIISNYQNSLDVNKKVVELNIKNIEKALIMLDLDTFILNKKINDLTFSEQFKIDLATKLDKEIIIIGNLSRCLNNKELDFIKKLLFKLNNDYNKKIVVIDDDVNSFINLVKHIYVLKNKEILYSTDDLYDDNLYKYTKMPKIIEFVKYVNNSTKRIDNHLDIYELIKDIFRRVS